MYVFCSCYLCNKSSYMIARFGNTVHAWILYYFDDRTGFIALQYVLYCMICFRSKNKWLVIHILIWLYVPTPMPLNRFYLNKEQSPIPPSFEHISVRSELMVIEYECKHRIHCTDADDASIHFIYTVDTSTRPLCSTRAVCRWRLGSCSDTR